MALCRIPVGHGIQSEWSPAGGVEPTRHAQAPQTENVRRPVASHDRFVRTLQHADAVDPDGRLACMLALARWTGHREGAICQLRAGDFLRTKEEVRAGAQRARIR